MKKLKKAGHILFYTLIIAMVSYIIAMLVAPDYISRLTGGRFYVVLTDSMEPRIPTYSLVFSRTLGDEELEPGQIITFWGDRFGDRIILTHHFNHTEKDAEGKTIYRTNAEGKDELDMYLVERKDIIGTYVFHIPYVGKFVLFLKSKYGFIWIMEVALIMLVNRLIAARWEEKEASKEDSCKVEECKDKKETEAAAE